jgi:membrane peptidoglycan carboxypeptidase
MVGYTPSISTAVWMGSDAREPIVNMDGGIIYGSGLPGAIWQRFMSGVLAGTPVEDLPDSPSFEGDSGEGVPAPTTEPPPATTTNAAPRTTTGGRTTTTPPPATTTESEPPAETTTPTPTPTPGSGIPSIPGGGNGNGQGQGPGTNGG